MSLEDTPASPQEEIAKYVARKIATMQKAYLSAERRAGAARELALLRRSVTKDPWKDPEIWAVEFEDMPERLIGRGDVSSPSEKAVHASLTLYAVHQQSQVESMHVQGREHELGAAVRQMVVRNPDKYSSLKEGEMPRRFTALATAETFSETLHYARQLIQQLRSAKIPLDYAKLASQLYDLQNPYRKDRVRLSWGRGYAYAKTKGSNAGTEAK